MEDGSRESGDGRRKSEAREPYALRCSSADSYRLLKGTSIALPEGWASWQLAVRIYQKSLVGKPAYGPEVFVFNFIAVFHQVMISGFSEEYEHKLTR